MRGHLTNQVVLVAMLAALAGCDRSSSGDVAGGESPFGDRGPASPLLQPFQVKWQFDLERTLALWKAKGVPPTQIAQARATTQAVPLHPDMRIQGNAAVLLGPGPLEGEYAFFAMHPHNQWAGGKAWHHEDRHDPGDMSKCYARLELKESGSELHLSLRNEETAANVNDPDLTNTPPTAGSATTCGADAAPDPPWSAWETYVFVRQ